MRTHAPSRPTLERARAVFGIPSVVVIAGFLLTESLVNIVINLLPNWQADAIWLAGCTAAALLAFDRWNRSVSSTLRADRLGRDGDDKLTGRRGLVIVLGLNSQAPTSPVAKLLAACPNLEYLALVGTPQTQSRNVARDILETLAPSLGRQVPAANVRVFEQGNNAQSVADFEQATRDAIAWMLRQGLEPHEVVVDTSDGRRAMGYGALVAAEQAGVEVQYLALEWDHMGNRPIPDQEMFKVVRELHTVAA